MTRSKAHPDSPLRVRAMAVELGIDEPDGNLRALSAQRIGIPEEAIRSLRIGRRSLDARRRGGRRELRFIVHADLELVPGFHSESLDRALTSGRASELAPSVGFELEGVGSDASERRIIVVGSGPAGLYAAWTLAANGAQVDVLDRGPSLRERGRAVARFGRTRELDPERNLLYGEGGAGTYSDGKLYTRTQHPLEAPIVQSLIDAGADPEIGFDARAHVGTDRLHRILPRLRSKLEDRGVRFHFDTKLEALVLGSSVTRDHRIDGVRTSAGDLPCDGVVLALGHSARDTFETLAAQGVLLEAKPFQLGLRVEHPQSLIDCGRYGEDFDAERLGHAYYGLVSKATGDQPAVHSFCMCPGGQIVAAVAQPEMLCTNGMSNSRHSSPWANSGIVVTVGPKETGPDVFDGVRYQESLERRFFEAGGSDYHVPAQRIPDFLAGRETASIGSSSYKLGLASQRVDRLLPESMTTALRTALKRFDRSISGYASSDGLLVGIESRSSSPLRMPRDPATRLAAGFENLWPVGEGAGYAGGIMSAAIDGARSAWALMGHREERTRS